MTHHLLLVARSFAGVGAGLVVNSRPSSHGAKERVMQVDDIGVFIGIDVGKSGHWATALTAAGKRACSMVCVSPCGRTDTDDCY